MLRVMLGGNLMLLVAVLLRTPDPALWWGHFGELAALVEPVLLATLVGLALLRDTLRRLALRTARLAVLGLAGLLAALVQGLAAPFAPGGQAFPLYTAGLAMLGAAVLLTYFDWRSGRLSPAQSEARLLALNARIRPHFLFNSLNAVLSLIRARPQEAEAALEALSDLFRAALRDPAALVRLDEELALGEQYLALEGLRLGERLRIERQLAPLPLGVMLPPLILQPLLENAIFHGIEGLPDGGVLRLELAVSGSEIRLLIGNPCAPRFAGSGGHGMALANIRERLALYYDLEARLETRASPDYHEVSLILPCPTH